ncbi:putative feruloyl esterase [Nemania sp. FL0031]|nr:putative feruloyl esterase [Nemania sp. FL0031]
MPACNMSTGISACRSAAIPFPTFLGGEVLSLETHYVANYTQHVPIGFYSNHGSVNVKGVNFCNVTVTYTHPGEGDRVNVQVWMPADTWNGRLQSQGGAGFQAGLHPAGLMAMTAALGEGYATSGTDAGLGSETTPANWGLLSEGNPNLYLLQNLGSVSLNDAAIISKSVIESYYGRPPTYSYFNGCSQGGRQGYMLAQRYPDAYDGIAASAPAINWNQFLAEELWPAVVMDTLNTYPAPCEIAAITAAAIKACDGLDGLVDGIISDPDACNFQADSMVGKVVNCTDLGQLRTISANTAAVVQETWSGAKRLDNSSVWFGVSKDSTLTGTQTDLPAIPTTCDASTGVCTRTDPPLAAGWLIPFVYKNSSTLLSNFTREEFDRVIHATQQQYESFVGTNDPDLSAFRSRGGKLLGYHGTIDSVIPTRGSEAYYDKVTAADPNVHDFYRLFLAPGVSHCFGGPGAFPDTTFDALRNWVENGIAPETLAATSVGTDPIIHRTLCPYPKKQKYDGTGDSVAGEGFSCV